MILQSKTLFTGHTMLFFCFVVLALIGIFASPVAALNCMDGSTLTGDEREFKSVDCGAGEVYCEYRDSTTEDAYEQRCSLIRTCERDKEDPLWENVSCCNDSDNCNGDGADSSDGNRFYLSRIALVFAGITWMNLRNF